MLIGAGHAHLHAIKQADAFVRRGQTLTVVAPGPFWYSGLATGMLGGIYPPELDQVDVAVLAARARGGARIIQDRMIGLDRRTRSVLLERHGSVHYDALSLNLGSAPPEIAGSDQPCSYSVKPIHRLRDLRIELESRFADRHRSLRIVIAGAGPTGSELAGNIAGLAQSAGAEPDILVVAGGDVLRQLPKRAAFVVRSGLERRGVRFLTGSRVVRLETGTAILADGREIAFDVFVNATGLKPRPVPGESGLPVTEEGGLIVDRNLRSPADQLVHGGGDGVSVEGHALPRIGVYAIRQSPVLLHNLLAAMEGTAPRPFEPQKHYFWIMNLGDGTGLATRGPLWWHGRSAFRLKDRIDRRFLRSYRPD